MISIGTCSKDYTFTPFENLNTTKLEWTYFNSGEPNLTLPPIKSREVVIHYRSADATEFMALLMVINGLQSAGKKIHLVAPSFPGCRQDRSHTGQPFGLKVYADIINQLTLESVTVVEPHSDVTAGVIDRVRVVDSLPYLQAFIEQTGPWDGLIAPDAGAAKRVKHYADKLDIGFCQATKQRNQDGVLIETNAPVVPEGNWLIVDDICDSGRTAVNLAKELNQPVGFWATHGIFSHGTEELNAHFTHVGCTDSVGINEKVTTIPL